MNILLLGSGGREHAIAFKIAQSTLCNRLFIAPGNAGTAGVGTNVDLDMADFAAMGRYLGCLAGIGADGFMDAAFLYALRSNVLLMAFAALCCGPGLRQWQLRLTGRHPLPAVVLFAALLVACTAYLVHGSYNPFLYFRF